MAKQKTHSGAKKRFKLTGTGKVKRGQAKHRHNLTVAKTHAQKKRLAKLVTFTKADEKNVKAMLPNG